jgi:hypothetical protein
MICYFFLSYCTIGSVFIRTVYLAQELLKFLKKIKYNAANVPWLTFPRFTYYVRRSFRSEFKILVFSPSVREYSILDPELGG